MAGCLIPLSSAASNAVGLRPSSVDCHISSPLRLIAASLLWRDPSRCLSTPSPSSVAVTLPGCRYCVVRGWHFESRLLRFSTRPILPLVDCSVSPLGALPGVHLLTNRVADAVAAGVEDQCNLRWPGVGATATDLFHPDVECRRPPPPISSISKSIPCHLFNCWVIVAVDVIAQCRRHRYNAGSSWSSAGGPLQTPDDASTSSVSSGTSS
jgi:hypothetical protein